MFPAVGKVLVKRGVRIFHVFSSYVLLGTPLVTDVSKLRVDPSTVSSSLGFGPFESWHGLHTRTCWSE